MNQDRSLEKYLLAVIHHERAGWGASLIRGILNLLEPVYYLLLKFHFLSAKRHTLPKPVISVGNITAGGTGKTPTVVWLARMLQASGLRPALLTRGYGGASEKTGLIFSSEHINGLTVARTGDEPYLLAKYLPGILIAVGRDRYRMALQALQADPAIDVFLLDDGFQFFALRRQLDIVLVDAARPFDNGHLIPRGLLREYPRALKRAEIILLTRAAQTEEDVRNKTVSLIRKYQPTVLLAQVEAVNSALTPLGRWGEEDKTSSSLPAASFLNGRRIGLMTAIGNPEQLRHSLLKLGAQVDWFRAYPDHHAWDTTEITRIIASLQAENLTCLVVTAKDGVKLERYSSRFSQNQIDCYIIELEFIVADPVIEAKVKQVATMKKG